MINRFFHIILPVFLFLSLLGMWFSFEMYFASLDKNPLFGSGILFGLSFSMVINFLDGLALYLTSNCPKNSLDK